MSCVTPVRLDDFRFKDKFEGLDDFKLQQAVEIVNTEFTGVYTLWGMLPCNVRDSKRELCISYLIAWALVNMFPDSLTDESMSGTGGMPLAMKKAGPVMIKYKDTVRQGGTLLDSLTTNVFGIQALLMIQSAPENYLLF